MSLGTLINRMMSAGLSAEEAGAIAAEIYALGVASASVRSSGAERTRRWREKHASQSDGKRHQTSRGDADGETSPNVTERHKPSQCDASTVSPIDTKIKNSSRQNSDRASRGTRIAPDWTPSDADRAAARQEGFSDGEIDREALRFRDFWIGKPGAGGVKLDWASTWRNWVRTSADRLGKRPAVASGAAAESVPGFYAKFGSEEQDAWDAYGKAKSGRAFPRDSKGGWRHPTQWPPGYTPLSKSEGAPTVTMRTMQ